jgi:hypothetical protein
MFSVTTNMHKKETKGPALMELFTATGKLKKVFFLQLEMFDVCPTGDTAHIDTIFKFLPHTRQHGCFLLAQTPSFSKLFISRTNGLVCRRVLCFLCTKCTLHSNHRLTVWYSNTRDDFSPGAAIFLLHTVASPSGRNGNYDEKQLTGGGGLSCSFCLYRFRKYVSCGFPIINLCNSGVHYVYILFKRNYSKLRLYLHDFYNVIF